MGREAKGRTPVRAFHTVPSSQAYDSAVKKKLLPLVLPLLLFAAACGPYRTSSDATAAAGDRLVAQSQSCEPDLADDTPTPTHATGSADANETSSVPTLPPSASVTPCGEWSEFPPTTAPATPQVVLAVTSTPITATDTPTRGPDTPTPGPQATPIPTGTSAAATATAAASGQLAYLSIGDGIQWGCCGALSSSSAMLFRDYLESSLGVPVIWQTSGTGFTTTDTFLSDGSQEPQMDFALKLIEYYENSGTHVAAITMSIGGNNLVQLGESCGAPPCVEQFVAALNNLREDLHVIYSRISAAKSPTTPLMVLLYYDADECTDPAGGAAVDAWNAVIAEVATQYGAFLVDGRALFKGRCDWFDANGLDANAAGHAAIAAEYRRVYESLPPQYHVAPPP